MKQEIKDKMMYIRNKWMYHTMHVKLDDAVDNCMIEAYSLAQEEYAPKGMPDKENKPVELQERATEYVSLQGVSYPMATVYQDMVRSQIFEAYLDGASTKADRIKELEAELAEAKEKIKDLEKWSNRTMNNLTHKRSVVKEQKNRIEELEAENEILKMENSHSKLVVDEAKREIDRLRGLVEVGCRPRTD